MKRLKINGLIFAFIFLCSPFLFIPEAGAFQFNVDPPKVSLSIKPGEKKSGYIHITNTTKKGMVHIKAYSLDVIYMPDGSNDFIPLKSTPWSLKDWLKINPSEFDILPQQEQIVRFQVELPPEARGGFYGVIFFQMDSAQPVKKEQATITIGVRIGTIVLVEAAGTAEYAAKINALDAVKKENSYEIGCTIQNLGNILIRPSGKAQIINAENNKVVAEISFNPKKEGIFPQTSRKLTADCKEPLGGSQYLVRVLLDYGGDTLLGAQASFNANLTQ